MFKHEVGSQNGFFAVHPLAVPKRPIQFNAGDYVYGCNKEGDCMKLDIMFVRVGHYMAPHFTIPSYKYEFSNGVYYLDFGQNLRIYATRKEALENGVSKARAEMDSRVYEASRFREVHDKLQTQLEKELNNVETEQGED